MTRHAAIPGPHRSWNCHAPDAHRNAARDEIGSGAASSCLGTRTGVFLPPTVYRITMITPQRPLIGLLIATILLAAGCATTQDTTNLLSAAGFNMIPATTPQQESELGSLPTGKVSLVPRDGTNYYVFPDRGHKILYVGQSAQYQEYQRLRLQKQLATEQLTAAQMNSTTAWTTWGPWSVPVMVPVIRR